VSISDLTKVEKNSESGKTEWERAECGKGSNAQGELWVQPNSMKALDKESHGQETENWRMKAQELLMQFLTLCVTCVNNRASTVARREREVGIGRQRP
jgi:hypothetical protein